MFGKLIKNLKNFFSKKNTTKLLKDRRLKIFATILLVAAFLYLYKELFVAAYVNGELIGRGTLTRELEKQAGSEALDSLITQSLIRQEGKKRGIVVSKEELDERISEIEKGIVAQGQTLESILALQGWSRKDLEEQIKTQILIEKLLANDIKITEEEITKYVEENKSFLSETGSEARTQAQSQLKQQKLSEKFQEWIISLKQTSKVFYFVKF